MAHAHQWDVMAKEGGLARVKCRTCPATDLMDVSAVTAKPAPQPPTQEAQHDLPDTGAAQDHQGEIQTPYGLFTFHYDDQGAWVLYWCPPWGTDPGVLASGQLPLAILRPR